MSASSEGFNHAESAIPAQGDAYTIVVRAQFAWSLPILSQKIAIWRASVAAH